MPIVSTACFLLSALTAYLCWFPLRLWLFSMLPVAMYAGLLKVVVMALLAYFGGILVPLFLFVAGLIALTQEFQ